MLRKFLIFLAACILIFFFSGIVITLIADFFAQNLPYNTAFEIFKKESLYHNGTVLLIGFFLSFAASKVNMLRYLFPRIISGHTLMNSGYEFFNTDKRVKSLYRKARKEIIICAQNHHYLANDHFDKFQEIVDYLDKRNIKIKIIMNDVEFLESAVTWEAVCLPTSFKKSTYKPFNTDHLLQNNFYHQLINATKNFYDLSIKKSNKIDLSVVPHVPVSMTFIDPKERNGFLVIVPNFFKAKNTDRPYFVVTKKYNRLVFEQYYKSYVEITSDVKNSLSAINKINSVNVCANRMIINNTKFTFVPNNKQHLAKIEPIE